MFENSIFRFSDRISNSILVGDEQLTAYNEFMVCAIPNRNNTRYTYKYDSKTKKVTLRGKVEDILNGTQTKSVTFLLDLRILQLLGLISFFFIYLCIWINYIRSIYITTFPNLDKTLNIMLAWFCSHSKFSNLILAFRLLISGLILVEKYAYHLFIDNWVYFLSVEDFGI